MDAAADALNITAGAAAADLEADVNALSGFCCFAAAAAAVETAADSAADFLRNQPSEMGLSVNTEF